MFHIPHQPTRHWVIQRGVWHIDDCLLFVLPWTPEGSFNIPEISTLPVWANLKNVPDCCYSRLGISHVASGLGEPILTHKPRLDPTSMGEAKVLVEMELDRDFPKLISLDDKQGNIFLVNVEYTWIPSMCERCGNLGHKAKRCLLPSTTAQVAAPSIDTCSEKHITEIEGLVYELGITPALQPTLEQENSTASPNSVTTLPILIDSQSTPITTPIMESHPSIITNTKVCETLVVDPLTTSSNLCAFESSSRFEVLGDVDEVVTEPSSSLSLTRGGRETKLPIKPRYGMED
ncbi:hypothetical protein F2Q70_00015110 [Brassica cretica]|uniref:CCHC-type domain-containing protein n=1 Tax=Brassica cretica TaxID=69181 RepID=A0A8S9HZE3_BRACR|nr:hypothetical protein F2Q70_00015110 [Brassica cretica]